MDVVRRKLWETIRWIKVKGRSRRITWGEVEDVTRAIEITD